MPDYEHDEENNEIGGRPAQEAANVIAIEHGYDPEGGTKKQWVNALG
jgi:hypothetical protein